VSATDLLTDLEAAGVRLSLAGDDLRYQTRPGVSIAPHTERITMHKRALCRELLQRQIIAVLDVEPAHFNREEYDRLCVLWHAQDAKEESTP
jgi:hypothetical protein